MNMHQVRLPLWIAHLFFELFLTPCREVVLLPPKPLDLLQEPLMLTLCAGDKGHHCLSVSLFLDQSRVFNGAKVFQSLSTPFEREAAQTSSPANLLADEYQSPNDCLHSGRKPLQHIAFGAFHHGFIRPRRCSWNAVVDTRSTPYVKNKDVIELNRNPLAECHPSSHASLVRIVAKRERANKYKQVRTVLDTHDICPHMMIFEATQSYQPRAMARAGA